MATTTKPASKLTKYRAMRDFEATPEPSGGVSPAPDHDAFVIQKHAASRMHYDFRLELDGVLLSWSVPKGPSLAPTQRRLAVRTEDHPLDYAGFEGVIPAGQYGGGTVSVWDRGTWSPEGGLAGARAGLAKGRLTFDLHGEKLRGRWHLVKTKPSGKQEAWLLFKGRDDQADDARDIVEDAPNSVLSGRSLDEIAAAQDRVWQSNRAPTNENATRAAKPATTATATATVARPAKNTAELLALVAQLPLGFKLTNLEKILYPEQQLTKGQLIAYLAVVAEWMLPQVADRPLTLVRCPEGRKKPCFFQKHVLAGSPPAVRRLSVTEADGDVVHYMAVDDMPGLVALAQMGTLEIHTWGAHGDKPERPDLLVFDLDPDPSVGWDVVAASAFEVRRTLGDLGLESWVKTTGGKGLHVCAPIERRITWDDAKAFTRAVAVKLEQAAPARYTTNMGKLHRRGRIFLDYLRNGRNATFIAPYSPRARDGAPVAVPISWEELAAGVDPQAFTTATVPRRLAGLARDPWQGMREVKQMITAGAWRAVGGKP